MTLIVADGSNSDVANSFVSLQFADEYHAVRNNSAWSVGGASVREAALIKATDFIENLYGSRFLGSAVTSPGLSWPRINTGYDPDVIPLSLQKAVCEFALQEKTVGLHAPLSRDAALKKKKIGPLEKEYFEPTGNAVVNKTAVGYLSGLLGGLGNGINRQVVRV